MKLRSHNGSKLRANVHLHYVAATMSFNDYDRERVLRRTYTIIQSRAWRDYHQLQPKPNSKGNHDVAATGLIRRRTSTRKTLTWKMIMTPLRPGSQSSHVWARLRPSPTGSRTSNSELARRGGCLTPQRSSHNLVRTSLHHDRRHNQLPRYSLHLLHLLRGSPPQAQVRLDQMLP